MERAWTRAACCNPDCPPYSQILDWKLRYWSAPLHLESTRYWADKVVKFWKVPRDLEKESEDSLGRTRWSYSLWYLKTVLTIPCRVCEVVVKVVALGENVRGVVLISSCYVGWKGIHSKRKFMSRLTFTARKFCWFGLWKRQSQNSCKRARTRGEYQGKFIRSEGKPLSKWNS